jgi:hypothetical protein
VITGWRRFSERLGAGASIFQDLDPGEALSAEAKLRPTEGGGEHPPQAKSFGKSSAEDLKRREMPPPPVTSYVWCPWDGRSGVACETAAGIPLEAGRSRTRRLAGATQRWKTLSPVV